MRLLAAALELAPAPAAALAAAARPAPAPPGGPAGPRHNLPRPLTSFVGREGELAAVGARLADPAAPLLTLTGPGGSCRPRPALRAAADALDRFRDGVWLVDLAPVADPALVPSVVARTLGVREAAGRPLGESLGDSLRDRRLLLVLDNCEHLVAACAALAGALLRAGPGVRLLATSRESLGVAGEAVWPVPPLPVPPLPVSGPPGAGDEATLAPDGVALAQGAAVRLFADRARAVRPDFALTAANAPAVAEVCRRLDGLPLALELAAARVRVLPPPQLLARLDDRFRLLIGGGRAAPPRQQTLRATMEWSSALLTEPERRLFARLAVFAGARTSGATGASAATPAASARCRSRSERTPRSRPASRMGRWRKRPRRSTVWARPSGICGVPLTGRRVMISCACIAARSRTAGEDRHRGFAGAGRRVTG